MPLENPLLAPRLFWHICLAVTAVLVVIRIGLYFRGRSAAPLPDDSEKAAAESADSESKEPEGR